MHGLIRFGVGALLCRLTVDGRENVPPTGGCVVASNHNIGPDYVVLGYGASRQIFYMAKKETFGIHPLLDRFLWAVGAFPVERGKRDQGAIQEAVDLVQSGRVLGMFPEGTRSKDGVLQKGRSGAIRIAVEAGVPILPAAVTNSNELMQRLLFKLWRRPAVTVRFGPPIYPVQGENSPQTIRKLTHQTMVAIATLLPPEKRGPYAEDVDQWVAQD
ncbi:MAG: lysophospholipid acyltransferase family protein [Chloroflexota bacterium]